MNDKRHRRLIKQTGAVSLAIIALMTFLVIAIPTTTKLVQQNQENRSKAAGSTCSSFPGDIGNKGCTGSYIQQCQTTNGYSVQWIKTSTYCDYGCLNGKCNVCKPYTTQCTSGKIQTCSSSGSWSSPVSCPTGQTCPSGKTACEAISVPPTSTPTPKTCSYSGVTYAIGKAICQGNIPAECLSTGSWKTFGTCPYGCSGSGICNPKPITDCASQGGSCAYSDDVCKNNWSGTVISGTNCSGSTPTCCKVCTGGSKQCAADGNLYNCVSNRWVAQNPPCAHGCSNNQCNPAPTCTYTVGTWSSCDPNTKTQTRTVTKSPSGCVGGTPLVTSEACTPPVICSSSNCGNCGTLATCNANTGCVWSYNGNYCEVKKSCTDWTAGTWSTCTNGIQTRSVTATPSGCNSGTPDNKPDISRSCCTSGQKKCTADLSGYVECVNSQWTKDPEICLNKCNPTRNTCNDCTPGTSRCTSDNKSKQTCNSLGTWGALEPCLLSQECKSGSCVAKPVTPECTTGKCELGKLYNCTGGKYVFSVNCNTGACKTDGKTCSTQGTIGEPCTSSYKTCAGVNKDVAWYCNGDKTAVINCAASNQNCSNGTCVAKPAIEVSSITLSPTSKTITVDDSFTIIPKVLPENATNKYVAWTSNATSIAAVDINGKVTAKSSGTAIISATTKDGSRKTATTTVIVTQVVSSTCTSADTKCIDGGRTLYYCDTATGTMMEKYCGTDQTCNVTTKSCVPKTPTPTKIPTIVKECEPLNSTKCETSATEACICKAYTWQCTQCDYGCLNGTCKSAPAPVCTDKQTRCANSLGLETCNSTRTGWTLSSCPWGCDFSTNTCKLAPAKICTPNTQYKCDGRRLMVCNADGSDWTETRECGLDQTCNASTKSCVSKVTVSTTKPKCANENRICVNNLFTCGDKYSGKVVEGTDCVSICCIKTTSKPPVITTTPTTTKLPTCCGSADGKSFESQSIMATTGLCDSKLEAVSSGSVSSTTDGWQWKCNPKTGTNKCLADTCEATKTVSTTTVSCVDQKGTCLPLGECKADNGSSIGKLDCSTTNICCETTTLETTPIIPCDPNKDNNGDGIVNAIDKKSCDGSGGGGGGNPNSCFTSTGIAVSQGKYTCDTNDNNKRKICAPTSVSDSILILKTAMCQTGYECKSNTITGAECVDKPVVKTCTGQKGTCLPLGECRADNGSSIGKYDCTGTNICCENKKDTSCSGQKGSCISVTEIANCKQNEGNIVAATGCSNSTPVCCVTKPKITGTQNVPVASISLDVKGQLLLKVGDTKKITATILPQEATNKEIFWSVSTNFFTSIDTNGKITAHKPGKSTVTVRSKDNPAAKATFEVEVVAQETICADLLGVCLSDQNCTSKNGSKVGSFITCPNQDEVCCKLPSTFATCNPKEDNNKDGRIDGFDKLMCLGKDGVCHPDYNQKTVKEPPSDSQACLIGNVVWNYKEIDGKCSWSCRGLTPNSQNDYCEAFLEKGGFGGGCQTNEDCQVNGLSRCVDKRCMTPGACVSTRIDSTTKTWKGSICIKDKQYVCNNLNNSIGLLHNDFWNFTTTDCPLGCDRNGIKCLSDGYKCVTKGNNEIKSEYYQDSKMVESIKCEFGCDDATGRCKVNPNSTSKNPICDAAGGTCFGNVRTCQEEGGSIVNKTDCTSPQVCCRVEENINQGCINPTTQRKYLNGYSVCAQGLDFDDLGASTGDFMIKCVDGKLNQTFCDNGCLNGLCLKGKNQSCKYNYECDSNYCGPGGMCLLKPEGGVCNSDGECQSNNCPLGICLKPGAKCDPKLKKGVDWILGCQQGQDCRQGQCITDGICGVANNKDGRTFASPPTEADNLCKYGKPTIVATSKDGNYTWQCIGDTNNGKTADCSANKGAINCDGQPEGSVKCANVEVLLTCTKDGWRPEVCSSHTGKGDFCVSDRCQQFGKPQKEGDYCLEAGDLMCPSPLVCDLTNRKCTTSDKLFTAGNEKNRNRCKSSMYNGAIIYDTDACPSGYSCNRQTITCEPIVTRTMTRYLKYEDVCTDDSQCISGFCRPHGTAPISICNDVDEKAYIDRGNKILTIGAAIVAAPFVVAAAPAVISGVGSWAMTNMTVMAAKFPALAALIAGADSVGDVGEMIYGLALCGKNPSSQECMQAMAIAQVPGLYANLVDEATDLFQGAGYAIKGAGKVATEVAEVGTDLAMGAGKIGDIDVDEPIKWLEEYFKQDKYKVADVAVDAGKIGDGVSDDTLDLWEYLKGEPQLVNSVADVAVAARKVGDEVADMAGDVGKVGDEVADVPWYSSKYSVFPDIKLLKEEVADVAVAARKVGDEMTDLTADVRKYSVDLSKTPGVPGSTKVDPAKLQVYLNSITDPDKRAALEILAEGVMQKHITHSQFVDTLNNTTITSVNRIIGNNKYVLVVEPGKSNKWVAELSMPSLSPKPEEVFARWGSSGANSTTTSFLIDNPAVRNVVFFDDASYSGSQLSYYASSLQKNAANYGINDLKIIIAVPYATTVAESELLRIPGVILADHKMIPTATEVFTQMQLDKLSTLHLGTFDKTVTTFDHKVADYVSTLYLQERYLEDIGGFIPNPIVPYKPGARR